MSVLADGQFEPSGRGGGAQRDSGAEEKEETPGSTLGPQHGVQRRQRWMGRVGKRIQ